MDKPKILRVTAPISSPDEVDMLAENGADEFYFGFVPQEWTERYTRGVWLNRRSPRGANLKTFDDLKTLVEKSHARGIPLFMTLNAHYFTADQIDLVVELSQKCCGEIGVDAVIVTDVGLILALRKALPNLTIHLSSLGVCQNVEAVRFFKDLGVRRIILPRMVTIPEIRDLVRAEPEMEFEAFILNDGCVYEEGFCLTTHAAEELGPFCLTSWEYDPLVEDRANVPPAEIERFEETLRLYSEWIHITNNCSSTMSEKGLPLGPCGLCALPAFHEIGVTSLKVVGREGSAVRKLRSVQLVAAVVRKVRERASQAEANEYAKQIRETRAICDSGYMCYYRIPQPTIASSVQPRSSV